MKKKIIFFAGLIVCFNLQSQVSQIIDSSMYGGSINAYAKNSVCVLVATDGGIFKTTNEGQNWTNATHNFDPYSVSCNIIVSITDDFYAMTNNSTIQGIFKSTDNGTNWSPLSFSSWLPQSLGKLSNTLYAIGGDMSGGRLYSSVDGISWSPKAMIWNNSWQGGNCDLLSFNQDKLYIAFNDTLYYTSDGNTIDTISFNGLGSVNFSDGDRNIGGDASGNLYYRGEDVLFKYNFITETWSDISTGKIAGGFQIMELSVTDNALFLSAMHSTLGLRLYRSVNQGSTFSELVSTGLTIPMIGNIIEVSTNRFIGNWLDDRILLSSDGGSTWSWNANQFIATFAGNLIQSGNSLLFSREIKGMIRTDNQGLAWNLSNTGIPGFGGIAYFVNSITVVKDTLFLFTRPDPYTDETALYKSTNNGASWSICPIPAPYTGEDHTFAGKCDSALFVNFFDTASSDYAFIVSFNFGSSWVKPNTQNSNEQIYLKGPKNCLFACYAPNNNWNDFNNVSRANNFGASFTDLNSGNLFNDQFLIKRLYNDRGDKGAAMMDFDAAGNKAIFVVRDRMTGNGLDKLYLHNMLTNGWSEISTTGLPSDYFAGSIKYVGNNVWLLATNTGLYKSTNSGIAWKITHNANEWQKGIIVNTIQVIADKAFLGTMENGVWVVDLSLGIVKQHSDSDLQIFPNPTAGIMNIMIPDFNGNTADVCLYDLIGKEMLKTTVNTNQFQLSLHNVPSGSYFLIINNGNHIYRETIIRK